MVGVGSTIRHALHCISKNTGLKVVGSTWLTCSVLLVMGILAGLPHLNMAERTYHVVEIFSGAGEIARNCKLDLGILLAIQEPI